MSTTESSLYHLSILLKTLMIFYCYFLFGKKVWFIKNFFFLFSKAFCWSYDVNCEYKDTQLNSLTVIVVLKTFEKTQKKFLRKDFIEVKSKATNPRMTTTHSVVYEMYNGHPFLLLSRYSINISYETLLAKSVTFFVVTLLKQQPASTTRERERERERESIQIDY